MASRKDNQDELISANIDQPVTSRHEENAKSSKSPSRECTGSLETSKGTPTRSRVGKQVQDVEVKETEDNLTTLMSSVDILRIKNKFLEIVEELRIIRVSDSENEQRIKELVAEKHEMERKLEDAALTSESKSEQHVRDVAEVKKQFEEQIYKLESEKHQTTVKTDIWEKEVKLLKEELRTLLVGRYSFEKLVKEQEHRIQMLSSTNESHMSQMTDLERRCKNVTEDSNMFRELLARLGTEVNSAIVINKKLSRVNTHQNCIIVSLTEETQLRQAEIVKIKAESNGKQQEEMSALAEKNLVIQPLQEEIASKEKKIQSLEDQIKLVKEEQQKTLTALSESHLLADHQLDNSLQSAKEVGCIKSELKRTKDKLTSLEKHSSRIQAELEELNMQKQKSVEELKKDITQREENLEKLRGEHDDLAKAYQNLEEVNRCWAKKNSDMNATLQTLTSKLTEKGSQLHELQLKKSKSVSDSRDVSTSIDGFEVDINTAQKRNAACVDSNEPSISVTAKNKTEIETAFKRYKYDVLGVEMEVDNAPNSFIARSNIADFASELIVLPNSVVSESKCITNEAAAEEEATDSGRQNEANNELVTSSISLTNAEQLVINNITPNYGNGKNPVRVDYTEFDSLKSDIGDCHRVNPQQAQVPSSATTSIKCVLTSSELVIVEHQHQTSSSEPSKNIPSPSLSPKYAKAEIQGQLVNFNANINEKVGASHTSSITSNFELPKLTHPNDREAGLQIDNQPGIQTTAPVKTCTQASSSVLKETPLLISLPRSSYNATDDANIINVTAATDRISPNSFKAFSHLSSPPLISIPVSRKNIENHESRFSLTLPSFGANTTTSSSLSKEEVKFDDILPQQMSTFCTEENTPLRYTARWLAPASDHRDTIPPEKSNSQEEWPDFVGEFSASSNSQHSVRNYSSVTRPELKRSAVESVLFSDEDDENDLKADVASQIDRIQVFLKNDRLKRSKKNNKEPVI